MFQKNECTINCTIVPTISGIMRQNTSNLLKTFQGYNDMKLAVILETRRTKTNGKCAVKIRFYFNAQAFYVSTGIEVPKANFMLGKVVGVPKATVYNNVIAQKLDYTQSVLEDLQLRGLIKTKFKTGTDIKRFIESGEDGYAVLDRDKRLALLFSKLVNNYRAKFRPKSSSDEQYSLMLAKVTSFCDIDNLFLDDVTVAWLKDFEGFCLQNSMSVNGTAFYMRAIRVVWNDAIDRELIGLDKYPFRRYKIKKQDTIHRNLSLPDMRKLINYDCTDKPHIARSRDMFLLSFYMCGINIKDLLLLVQDDVRWGKISKLRKKTNVIINLKLEPEAIEIINRYKGENYLLNIMDVYGDYDDFRRKMNKYLKVIIPGLTVYWARHTWATFAAELDVPDAVIDMAQAHKLKGMNAVYVARNVSKVYEANRKVIDYVITTPFADR